MRVRLVMLCTILMLAGVASACMSAQPMGIESFWKSESTIVIPVTDKYGTAQIQFPAMPKKPGQIPVIRFKAYLKTPTFAGWNQYMKLDLNGSTLGQDVGGTNFRIINRDKRMNTTDGPWSVYKDDLIFTYFYPGGDEVDSRIKSNRDQGCWYVLDVSDAANRVIVGVDNRIESQEPNRLTITNTYKTLTEGETAPCKEFIVENLEAGYMPEGEVKMLRQPNLLHIKPCVGPSLASGDAKVTVGKDGAIQLRVGGESYYFAGVYSYPGTDKMNTNSMGMPGQSSPDWKIMSLLNKAAKKLIVKGDWKNYTVTRTIVPDSGRFHIYDKITNKTDKPLGMAIKYNAVTDDSFGNGKVHLCGSGDLVSTENCGTNPSIFIEQNKSSMGLVVEDTVFRLQMTVARLENSVEYATKHFGLAPKKSYTLEWTIYPSKSTDYWDFVNRVRKDWHVNYTVLGPCPLGDEKIIPGRKSLLHPLTPWFRYYSKGERLTPEQYKEEVRPKIEVLRASRPDVIPMGMIETNLVPYDTRQSNGKIPTGTRDLPNEQRVGYGLELTKEQTEYVKKTPWWNSQIKTADGRGVMDSYYSGAPYCNLMVYPAPGNHQLDYMLWQVDYLMDKVGMKGIYIDQFNLGLKLDQPGRSDYNKWDGHTVDLKPNGEISRMYTDGTLVGSPARAEIIRHILKKGGAVITNGHPVSKETTGLPMLAIAETEWDLSSAEDLLSWNEPPYMPSILESNLSSPIGLGIRPSRFDKIGTEHWSEIIHKWVITCLKNGALYYYYAFTIPTTGPGAGEYGIINHMFPFTPVEIRSGVLIGKERILTAKSGSFFWNNAKKPIVLAFDSKGYKIEPKSAKIVRKGKGWQVDLSLHDWQETAVIEDPAEK